MPELPPLPGRDTQASSAASSSLSTKTKKRKQSTTGISGNKPPPNRAPSSSNDSRYQQPTIPSLFASSSQLSDREESPSLSKKAKSDVGTPNEETVPMSTSTAPRNVVDLTSSPSPSTRDVEMSTPVSIRNGPRKIIVKNLRKTPKVSPETFVQKTWASIDAALTAIFEEKPILTSMEELYRGTEDLCRAERSAFAYEGLQKRCTEYVSVQMKGAVVGKIGRSAYDDGVVKTVEMAWEKWGRQLGVIRSILFYLDRSYLLSSPKLLSIWDMGTSLFCEYIIKDSVIKPRYLSNLFNLYDRDRKGMSEPEDSSLIVSGIRMISTLGLYSNTFEPKFIDMSEGYYRILANDEAEKGSIKQYANLCAAALDNENTRCERYNLESSTKRELIKIIEAELVQGKLEVLKGESGIQGLLEKRDLETLKNIYSLIDRVEDAGKALKAQWGVFILKTGADIVADQARESEMVSRLLKFKESLGILWAKAFNKSEILDQSLRDSFGSFINERRKSVDYAVNSKPSEMIAKYVDLLLRLGVKALTSVSTADAPEEESVGDKGDEDAQLALQLEQVLDLFRFIHGKDVFEAFYKKDLARRLLMGRSASADAEKIMLSKLKNECGAGFTSNLEIMFKDVELSRESMILFKNSRVGHEKSYKLDLSVSVLAQSAWPTYLETVVNLPAHVAKYLDLYQQFYTTKHKGRKLMWRHALAQAVLKAAYPAGPKELVVSSFQAVVLLLFNDSSDSLGYEYIKSATSLTDKELARTLQSLACGRYRVLTKTPKGKDINPATDKFTFNTSFADPKMRIKINQIQLKETKEENKATNEQIIADRVFETQAAIVRIMKARQTIGHTELIQQTIEHTKKRGVLDVGDIKKQIEKLIEKDYMERIEGEKNMYRYVA